MAPTPPCLHTGTSPMLRRLQGKGNEFIAVPVSDVFTFKPALNRRNQRCARRALHGCLQSA